MLQDAGLSCFECVEQLTLLLFLKMADQLTEEPYNREPIVPPELGWKALLPLAGAPLENQYRESLEKLGVKTGMLGDSLPAPAVIAAEIADDLEAALEQFTKIAARLK